jgi:hypothetical protein
MFDPVTSISAWRNVHRLGDELPKMDPSGDKSTGAIQPSEKLDGPCQNDS